MLPVETSFLRTSEDLANLPSWGLRMRRPRRKLLFILVSKTHIVDLVLILLRMVGIARYRWKHQTRCLWCLNHHSWLPDVSAEVCGTRTAGIFGELPIKCRLFVVCQFVWYGNLDVPSTSP